jgi:hypothetical protein
MPPEDQQPRLEREQTDESLRVERDKADQTLEDGGSAIDETADAVISRARSRADEVLAAARAKTDRASAPGTPIPKILKSERVREDQVLQEERATADEVLREERAEHLALLSRERQETDKDLRMNGGLNDALLNRLGEGMAKTVDLLQGTLDMLILKAVSIGPRHGTGFCSASNKSPKSGWKSSRARSIRRCIGSSTKASLRANGANRRTGARASTTASRHPVGDSSGKKHANGIG